MTARLEAFRKPVIAAVNGLRSGGGCEITEAVHLAIASERAQFAKPEINLGYAADLRERSGCRGLPAQARARTAATGDPFSPQRALEIGLVNSVVPHDVLLPPRRTGSTYHLAFTTRVGAIHRRGHPRTEMTIGEGCSRERAIRRARADRDLGEGINAWIERRPPVYAGR